MKHIMVDIETMGNKPDAPLASIAAVMFDPATRTIGATFRTGVRLSSSVKAGAQIDPDTVVWWLSQSPEAVASFLADQKGAPSEVRALNAFSRFIHEQLDEGDRPRLWGNGATFDNVILDAAYRRQSIGTPWRYSDHRCYRTLRNLAREVEISREGVSHDPMDDAMYQVRTLFAVLDALRITDLN